MSLGLSAVLLLILASPCVAQESASRMQGYFFVAPGLRTHEEVVSGVTHFGGGGEVSIYKGLAAGAEIGYLRPWQKAETYEDLGMLSLDALYRLPKSNKQGYFVAAGVSFGLRDRTLSLQPATPGHFVTQTLTLLNFGFGGTYWFNERKGLRIEIRDHLYVAETDRHYIELRLGFAIR
jgi:hypothetical protein